MTIVSTKNLEINDPSAQPTVISLDSDAHESELISDGIYDNITPESKERFYQAGWESHLQYQKDGLHVTLEEMESWLYQKLKDPNLPPLKCHK